MPDIPEPITRKEHFLAKAAGEDVTTPTPITREEKFLDKIASGGSLPTVTSADNGKVLGVVNGAWDIAEDAGEVLPDVTTADNNKVLGVVGGTWDKMSVPTELPMVTASDNGKVLGVVEGTWTARNNNLVVTYTITGQAVDGAYPLSYSHTLAQIAAAYAAGRDVLGYTLFNGIPVTTGAIVRAAAQGEMDYAGIAYSNDTWIAVEVAHFIVGGTEEAKLYMTALNTTQMTFDPITGTLDITG